MEFVRKNRIPRSTTVRRGFLGYHPSPRIGAAQWFHEENLSSRRYPLLCPREPRRRLLQEPVEALASLNGLCYLSGNTLHYGEHSLQLPLSQGEKQLIPFGAYLVLMPDGLWVNTLDHSWDFCRKEAQFQGNVGIVWCRADGTAYETIVDGEAPPKILHLNPLIFLKALVMSQTMPLPQELLQLKPAPAISTLRTYL